MLNFIPGLKLSELFYTEAAKPILETVFPQISYSAALIGSGSEVLCRRTESYLQRSALVLDVEREGRNLSRAYGVIARLYNALQIHTAYS